ncbi:MAG: DNA-3-methyladenine glycosylase 2 family protein [Pseudomonadota bacterium]
MRLITCIEDVEEGAAWLRQRNPAFAAALDTVGPLPLRLRPDGFGALLHAIVSQQVSVASANAIWARLDAAGCATPVGVLSVGEDGLRNAGLSRQKIGYAIALANAGIDFDALRHAPDAAVVETLTAVKGIGVWTAEIYAMFSLGRPDVFAPGDLALQEAARMILDLPERPSPRDLRQMAEDWSPWRAVAARLFFTYYRYAKGREGVT